MRLILFSFLLMTPVISNANVVGSDFQNFNPTSNGLDFVTVQSSETLLPGVVNLGLFYNMAKNTLPYFNVNEEGYDDTVGYVDVNVGLGLLPNWDIGLNLPFNVYQQINVDDDTDVGYFDERGNTEVRLSSKFRFLGDKDRGLGVVGTITMNQIKNNPYKGDTNAPDYVLEVVGDTTWGRVGLGMNLGYKFRSVGDATDDDIEPYDDAFIWSVAASYLIPKLDTKMIFEIFGSSPMEKAETSADRAQAALEMIAGLKHDFTTNLAGHFGGGTELDNSTGSPDWRVYAGVNWAFGPIWGVEPEVQKVPKAQLRERFIEPIAEEVEVADEVYIVGNINFKFASFKKINPGGLGSIDELMEGIIKSKYERIIISGHTDSIGSNEYNQALSEDRALQVKKYLMQRYKIPSDKIESVGYGEDRPIADNGNYQGRKANRRVEIEIFR